MTVVVLTLRAYSVTLNSSVYRMKFDCLIDCHYLSEQRRLRSSTCSDSLMEARSSISMTVNTVEMMTAQTVPMMLEFSPSTRCTAASRLASATCTHVHYYTFILQQCAEKKNRRKKEENAVLKIPNVRSVPKQQAVVRMPDNDAIRCT